MTCPVAACRANYRHALIFQARAFIAQPQAFWTKLGRNRFGSNRFGSGLSGNSSVRFCSVWTMNYPGSTRFGLRSLNASWFGPFRFGSVLRLVQAGSEIKRFGLVRFGRFGSVRFITPSCYVPHMRIDRTNRTISRGFITICCQR